MRSYFSGAGCGCRTLRRSERPPREVPRTTAALFRLLSVQSRLEILCVLTAGPHCVKDIVGHTGRSQTLTSHHLSSLELGGLVGSRRQGRVVVYHLTRRGQAITHRIVDW